MKIRQNRAVAALRLHFQPEIALLPAAGRRCREILVCATAKHLVNIRPGRCISNIFGRIDLVNPAGPAVPQKVQRVII